MALECHQAKLIQTFLRDNHIETLDWPKQSLPDMNPIENLLAIIQIIILEQLYLILSPVFI
jgi:hypothetical protein